MYLATWVTLYKSMRSDLFSCLLTVFEEASYETGIWHIMTRLSFWRQNNVIIFLKKSRVTSLTMNQRIFLAIIAHRVDIGTIHPGKVYNVIKFDVGT